ncbi:NAD-P-binding protein [Cyathus striatus]|nr:NAD-P-binding protein [Cyathus striatus]
MGNIIGSRNFDPAKDLVDLKGKVVIVTGGNTGIGFATVQHLARAGAKVYLAARNESKATGAIARLEHEGLGPGNGEVIWLKLDLSDPRDVKTSAEDFLKREERLDILVNNAGVLTGPFETTKDGISTMVAVNYVGPFVFTRSLLPLLEFTAKEAGSDVRIVNVTSIMHKSVPSPINFTDLSDLNPSYSGKLMPGMTRYAHSKLLSLLWSITLQHRLSSSNTPITVIAIHPGGVDTFSDRWPFPRISKFLIQLVIAEPVVGAYNSAFAATGKKINENKEEYKGTYLESRPTGRVAKLGKEVNVEKGEELWALTEKVLQEIGV